jgi:phosphoglycolate phosphatase
MQATFMLHDLAPPSRESVRHVIGLRLDHAIALLHNDATDDLCAALTDTYKQVFAKLRERPDHHEPMFPGMLELVAELGQCDVALGIATGKSMRGLRWALVTHGIAEHFETLQTPDNAPGKPHPGMVLQAMAETGADPATTVVVGDTTFDMEMARAAGAAAIGVAWGYHEPDRLATAGAQQIAADAAELARLLNAYTRADAAAAR